MGPTSGPVVRERSFRPVSQSASEARRFVKSVLTEAGLSAVTDRMLILAGELAVNVILHARTPFTVRLAVPPAGAGTARLEVRDGSTQPPRRKATRGVDPLTFGRGVPLIEATADRWGVEVDGDGKLVWAEVDV